MSRRTPTSLLPQPLEHDPDDEQESSGVLTRPSLLAPAPEPRSRGAVARFEALRHPAERSERIEQKVRLAAVLVEQLPPSDPTARLLRTAITRRDEVLLDGLLSELSCRVG